MRRTGPRLGVRAVAALMANVALCGTLAVGASAGSSPPNDSFVSAIIVNPGALPYSASVYAGGATNDANEPPKGCAANSAGSLWWRFTPSVSATYRVDTIGSDYNTLVDVFRGTALTNLVRVDCNNDIDSNNPDLLVSRLAFRATAGQVHYIRVTGASSSGSNATLHLRKVTPPGNDAFANAANISALPFDANANNIDATSQTTEPRTAPTHFGPTACTYQRATRWYKYTPSTNQVIWANTYLATDFDTVLGVYTGSKIGSASLVACNNNQWSGNRLIASSGVTFKAQAGVTYRFQVGGFDAESGDTGELPFHVRAISPEANDDFANALTFTNVPYRDALTLRRSTTQAGEPNLFFGVANTVWYRYSPVTNTPIELTVEGDQTFAAAVALYEVTGPGFDGLTFLASGSPVGYPTTIGTTYMVQVHAPYGYAPAGTLAVVPDI